MVIVVCSNHNAWCWTPVKVFDRCNFGLPKAYRTVHFWFLTSFTRKPSHAPTHNPAIASMLWRFDHCTYTLIQVSHFWDKNGPRKDRVCTHRSVPIKLWSKPCKLAFRMYVETPVTKLISHLGLQLFFNNCFISRRTNIMAGFSQAHSSDRLRLDSQSNGFGRT